MSNRANDRQSQVSLSALLRAVGGACIVVALAAGLQSAYAAPVTFWVSAGGGVRAENGRAIFFKLATADPTSPQIQVFDRNGASVESLNPLAAVPDAKECDVWGVSVGPRGCGGGIS